VDQTWLIAIPFLFYAQQLSRLGAETLQVGVVCLPWSIQATDLSNHSRALALSPTCH
jgi:hypothetical protein